MILKVKHTGNFTTISREAIIDRELSLSAKGLLTYLMSLPQDWQINLQHLATTSRTGITGTRTALNELVESGYIKRSESRQGGKFEYDYIVSDQKQFAPACPICGITQQEHQHQGEQEQEEQQQTANQPYNHTTIQQTANQPYNHTTIQQTANQPYNHTTIQQTASPFNFTQQQFAEILLQIEPTADEIFYFNKIKNYSLSKALEKSDWKAYLEMWIAGDKEKAKLKIKAKTLQKPTHQEEEEKPYQRTIKSIKQDLIMQQNYPQSSKYTPDFWESKIKILRQIWKIATDTEKTEIQNLSTFIQQHTQIQDETETK